MECRTTSEMLDVGCTVELEFVENVEGIILYDIEIAVIAVAGYEIAVFTVPFGMLHAHILSGDHLAVEHHIFGAVLLIVFFHQSEYGLDKGQVVGIVVDLKPHKFSSFHQSVDANGEILAADVDISCVEKREHAMALQLLQILIVGQLYLMGEVDDVGEEFLVVLFVVYGILDATVEIDSQHALRAGRHASGT